MVIQSGVPQGAGYGHLHAYADSMPNQHGGLPGYISSGMPVAPGITSPPHYSRQPSHMPSHQWWSSSPDSSHDGGYHHSVNRYGTYPHDSAKVQTMRYEYSSDWEASGGGSGFSGMSSGSQYPPSGSHMYWAVKGVK
ncbi:hypothetical protein NMG60_11030826 [Bertholletia excelsa]